jgi:hypothetical protein
MRTDAPWSIAATPSSPVSHAVACVAKPHREDGGAQFPAAATTAPAADTRRDIATAAPNGDVLELVELPRTVLAPSAYTIIVGLRMVRQAGLLVRRDRLEIATAVSCRDKEPNENADSATVDEFSVLDLHPVFFGRLRLCGDLLVRRSVFSEVLNDRLDRFRADFCIKGDGGHFLGAVTRAAS